MSFLLEVVAAHPEWADGCGRFGQTDRVFCVGRRKRRRFPSWRQKRLRLFCQLGFLKNGNVDIVAVEESQKFSGFSADSARVPLHQLQTVSGYWCRVQCSFRYRRHTEAEVGAAVPASAAPPQNSRLDE